MLAVAMAVGVAWGRQVYALRLAGRYVEAVAGLDVPIKYESLTFQRAALADGHILPIYGSSELFCCGSPYRPTQLFASAPSGFAAFAAGRYGGTGDLFFLETFAALGHDLAGRKLVISDSPPWFSHRAGANPAGYIALFSPEIAYAFVFAAPVPLRLREAGARRMLDYPQTLRDQPLLRAAVRSLADPTPLHLAAYAVLDPLGRLEAWIERVRGAAQTVRFIRRRRRTLRPNRPPHPAALDWVALAARGTTIAERRDTTNPFGFPNWTYRRLLHKGQVQEVLALYQSGSTNRDGQLYAYPSAWEADVARSLEWTDLRLEMEVLRALGARPLVWSVPMPGFYEDYTPLAARARQGYYDTYGRTAEQAGVPWLDFRDHDEDPYFLTDLGSHLSPRGWIFADRALDLFWHGQSIDRIRAALTALGRQVPPPSAARTPPGMR